MKTFSIVVPVYQNEANLPTTVPALLDLAGALPGYRLELVLVDDGSTDRSREMILDFAGRHPENITAVLLTRNFGQNAATQAGLRHAAGDCIGVISCDLQEPHREFLTMVAAWERGARFVLAERVGRAEGWVHRQLSGSYWFLIRRLAFPRYPVMGFDFCLIDRQVATDVNRINEKNTSIFTLIYWLGYRPVHVPITRELRQAGKSQWSLAKKLKFTADTLIGFTTLPVRLITMLGFGLASLSLVYFFCILVRYIVVQSAPPGWMTLFAVIMLFGALNLFAVGILSEYLLRILDESRKRPPYVVEQVLPGRPPPAA